MIVKYLKHKPGAGWQEVNGELTFNRYLIAREFEEPSKAGKLETATTAGAPVSDDTGTGSQAPGQVLKYKFYKTNNSRPDPNFHANDALTTN